MPQLTPRQRAQRLALLPQASHDAFDYAVQDAVAAARFAWPDAGDKPQRVAAALDAFDLGRLATRPLQALSGGERQRVALASVMAQDAPLILLDEPSNSLDLAHQAALQQQIGRWRAQGKAVLLVSVELDEIMSLSDRILVIADGRIVGELDGVAGQLGRRGERLHLRLTRELTTCHTTLNAKVELADLHV